MQERAGRQISDTRPSPASMIEPRICDKIEEDLKEGFVKVRMKRRTYEASETAKREICSALKALMAQKPLNKITVAEVMQSCGMARQHFYYHFDEIYDAVRWMFDQEAVALLREHEGVMGGLPVRPAFLEPGTSEALFSDGYPRHHPEHDPKDRYRAALSCLR